MAYKDPIERQREIEAARVAQTQQAPVAYSFPMEGAPSQPIYGDSKTPAQQREEDRIRGMATAQEFLFNDPAMQAIQAQREDLAKGYLGSTLGAIRAAQTAQIDSARRGYLSQLAGKTARAGVGGARAAAMQGAADIGFLKQRQAAEAEQAMAQEKAIREGQQSLQDYMMKRKFGVMAQGLSEQAAGAQERAGAAAAAAAGKERPRGFLSQIFGDII